MDVYLQHLRTLGLEPGVSFDEVRRAYAEMSSKWHPSRFEDNPRMQERARDTLKELDEAYRHLMQRYEERGEITGGFSRPTVVTEAVVKRPPPRTPKPKKARRKASKQQRPVPRSLGRIGRYSATVAALAVIAWIVIANPDMTAVRNGALFLQDQFDAVIARIRGREAPAPRPRVSPPTPSTRATTVSPDGIAIPMTLAALTRGKIVEALTPTLSPARVLDRYGEPRYRNQLEWNYGSYSILFMDSTALLLVRDSASAR